MRILANKIRTKMTVALLSIFGLNLQASDIEIRFDAAGYNSSSQEIFVDIQVRNTDSKNVIIAGQNYRFYYDSEVLSLDIDDSKSSLSGAYGELNFEDHKKGIDASHVGQFLFDDNLGFANFSIDLTDNVEGGVSLEKDKWYTVATLKFEVLKVDQRYDIIWGREGVSDLYATAFVEIGEWISSNKLAKANITYYGDFSSELESAVSDAPAKVQVGPNPASDFVLITFEKEIKNRATIILRDLTGKQVKEVIAGQGSRSARMNIADIIANSYLVEIHQNGFVQNSKLVVAK